MASGYNSFLSVRSQRSPLPGYHICWPRGDPACTNGGSCPLNRLESPVNSASAVEPIHINSNPTGVVSYVETANICPNIALQRPGQPGNPGDSTILGTAVGSVRKSQRLASKPLMSYSSGNAHTLGALDCEAELWIRTSDTVALPTPLVALQPRPSSSVAGSRQEDVPDRSRGVTILSQMILTLLMS